MSDHPAAGAAALSVNPANGEILAWHAFAAPEAIDAAMDAADGAFRQWRMTTPEMRAAHLMALADVLDRDATALASLATLEMGKPAREARAEIAKCAKLCRWYAEAVPRLLADEIAPVGDGTASVRLLPMGCVLGIMPWNFPFWQVLRAAVPIVAGGNVFLLKHAENVQGCANALMRAFEEAGWPRGVVGALNLSRGDVGKVIADRRIVACTATSGLAAGRSIAAAAGHNLKKTVLELGGSDAFIVLDDADLDIAVDAAVTARFQNCGQVCLAAKRFIVGVGIAAAFSERLAVAASALRIGDPGREETDLGPMARVDLRSEVHRQVTDTLGAGARLALGGTTPPGPGAFYPPTVLYDVRPGMPSFDEEVFGPVASVTPAQTLDHAIHLANQSNFGLSASIWTRDTERLRDIGRALEVGGVFINRVPVSDPAIPIGGVKASGYGRELSYFGLREFLNAQTLWAAA